MTATDTTTMTDTETETITINLTDKHIDALRELWCRPHRGGAGIDDRHRDDLAAMKLVTGASLTDAGHLKCHQLIASGWAIPT